MYREICAAAGNAPDLAEMPVEYEDLLLETQTLFELYNMLDSRYCSASGAFLGKSIVGIDILLRAAQLNKEFDLFYISIIKLVDSINVEASSKKTQQELDNGGKKDG